MTQSDADNGKVELSARFFFDGEEVPRLPRSEDTDVSVVIPLFRSQSVLPHLLRSLEGSDATRHELIFVSDGDGVPRVPGKLVVLPHNHGYPVAVNEGARHADGPMLCLLNADVEVTPGWLASMVALIEEVDDAGAVGGRILNAQGNIDSVGSEFDWSTRMFEHVLMGEPDSSSNERDFVDERDMMTAACLLVRRDLWEQLGGFDENYRIGYFEDSDLCMRIRASGRRILYCPRSVITHQKGHSGRGHHSQYAHNRALFNSQWVATGRVDEFACRRGRKTHRGDIVACMIALNEEEYIQASIESAYPLADRIVVVEGGNDYAVAAGVCGSDKRSTDRTLERIETCYDPDKKIELITGPWRDKAEQRNAYAGRLNPGDLMVLLDADEVFHDAGLWRLSALMHDHDVIMPGFDLFWNDFGTLGTGVWDIFPQVKVVRWAEGYHYEDHNVPCDRAGRPVTTLPGVRVYRGTGERLYAHYSWVKPISKLRAKAAYYERQPGAAQRMCSNYIDDVFLPWRTDPSRVERGLGTHPFGGGGSRRFLGQHPESIACRLAAGEFNWEG